MPSEQPKGLTRLTERSQIMAETKKCTKCKEEKPLGLFPGQFVKKQGKYYYQGRCKSCRSEYRRKQHAENPEIKRAYDKQWRLDNLEKVREYDRVRWFNGKSEQNKEYRANNPEKVKTWRKRDYEKNKSTPEFLARANAISRRHQAAKRNAVPVWADLQQIKDIYLQAKKKSKDEGLNYQVDHIVPLQGNEVCGLHVEYNLQILTAEENIFKSNKLVTECGIYHA